MRIQGKNLILVFDARELLDFNFFYGIDALATRIHDATVMLLQRTDGKKFDFKNGIQSIKTRFKLKYAPQIGNSENCQPLAFINKYNLNEHNTIRIGMYQNDELFLNTLKQGKDKNNILRAKLFQEVLSKGIPNSVLNGTIPANQARHYEYAVDMVKDSIQSNSTVELKDGDVVLLKNKMGNVEFKFTRRSYVDNARNNTFIKNKHGEWTLELDDSDINQPPDKRKHYYIYSTQPDTGKTYILTKLRLAFETAVVTDVNNFEGVPSSAGIILFDEYGKGNMLDFSKLKQLTSGNAELFSGNCKCFGKSWSPPSDAQVIIASNLHPFYLYGVENRATGECEIEYDVAMQIKSRFHIINFGGRSPAVDEFGCLRHLRDQNQIDAVLGNESQDVVSYSARVMTGVKLPTACRGRDDEYLSAYDDREWNGLLLDAAGF